ncbi:MAG: CPBP family intramembrane metalloprotease [Pseudobutyrivibrio sp.]|nr:CPBP family intramembrane metalloprotease [Pseudobutyrivibrio sp.]
MKIKTNRIIQIVYPLLVYFIIYQLGVGLLLDIIGDKYDKLWCLIIAAIACLIPMTIIFRSVPKLIPEPINSKKQVINYALWTVGVVAIGVAFNVILTISGIIEVSDGFKRASDILTDGSFYLKVLCNCIVIPVLEELLLRGIVAGQLYLWYGTIPALLISSICVGILHKNIVQFIYALIMGFALGFLYIKNKRLSLCFIAHGLINLFAIIFG